MAGIALAGLFLGSMADRRGRRFTVLVGLALFAAASALIAVNRALAPLLVLLFVSGLAIGIFKTGAIALIGDLVRSPAEHTREMNIVVGFFAVGAIVGPPIVSQLLADGLSWTALYGLAGGLTLALLGVALAIRFPAARASKGPNGFDLSGLWRSLATAARWRAGRAPASPWPRSWRRPLRSPCCSTQSGIDA